MKTSLNVRKQNVLTLAVLALLMAAAVFLTGPLSAANLDGSLGARLYPTPRVRFASLGGRKPPAALDGYRSPAAQEGYRGPSALEGRWTPAALAGWKGPGWRNPAALEGFRGPGWRGPAALNGLRGPSALGEISAAQAIPLTMVDGLVVLALAALLLIPARKTSPGLASQARN